LVQFKPGKADVPGNLERIRGWVRQEREGHDILVFPETSLTGYFLEGGVTESAVAVEEVAAGLGSGGEEGPDLVLGFYERWRRGIYNSVGYFQAGKDGYSPVHVHRKLFLPTYGIFEEGRFADPGRDILAFDSRFGRLGLLVCEDMWHSLTSSILALDGAEVILVVSASPAREFRDGSGRPENLARWDGLAQGAAQEHGVYLAVCQLVGYEGGKVFPGGSLVAGPDGSFLTRGPLLEEGIVSAVLDGASIERSRFDSPLLADLRQMLPHLQRALNRAGSRGLTAVEEDEGEGEQGAGRENGGMALGGRGSPGTLPTQAPTPETTVLELDLELVRRILVEFMREEVVRRRGFEGVVLGVSGGVDSAVSLYLAV